MIRRLLLLLTVVLCSAAGILGSASPAAAHNTLVSSDPATGTTVAVAPTQLSLVFDRTVPLDTVSIELIDASGVRSDLTGSSHGPNGDAEVVTPLPALPAGPVNLRWRLVGPDGHPITGRISFSITPTPDTSTTATVALVGATTTIEAPVSTTPSDVTSTLVAGPISEASTTVAALVVAPATSTTPTVAETTTADGFSEPWSTASSIRWFLRMVSYLGIMTVAGVLATVMFVWPRAWSRHVIRQAVMIGIGSAFVAGVLQLLVVASDISGDGPRASIGRISDTFSTDAGVALALRLVLLPMLGWVMFANHPSLHPVRWLVASGVVVVLLGTWAYAGHSRSMRWPLLGVPLDVAHHAAAGAWIGGLAIVGLVTLRDTARAELVGAVGRFGKLASVSVGVLVGTGILQSIRLIGSPTRVFDADHGRYLVVKVIVLAAMLKVADINRQRVSRRFQDPASATGRVSGLLRRAMGTELAVGVAIIGITAALVVSPPAVAQDDTSPSTQAPVATTSENPAALVAPIDTLAASTSTTPPAALPCVVGTDVLTTGATGPAVLCLQQTLATNGLYTATMSGEFDAATDAAVRAAQQQHGLLVDGIVGQDTATALGIWPGS